MKSRVHPTYKTKYRVKNWSSYDRALVRRGDITVWLSPEGIAAWTPASVGRRGGQLKYSDVAIEVALTLRLIFNLPLRQAEGFLNSMFVMMGIDLSAPDHTTLSTPTTLRPFPISSVNSTANCPASSRTPLTTLGRSPTPPQHAGPPLSFLQGTTQPLEEQT